LRVRLHLGLERRAKRRDDEHVVVHGASVHGTRRRGGGGSSGVVFPPRPRVLTAFSLVKVTTPPTDTHTGADTHGSPHRSLPQRPL
jgi:hypothetical protein